MSHQHIVTFDCKMFQISIPVNNDEISIDFLNKLVFVQGSLDYTFGPLLWFYICRMKFDRFFEVTGVFLFF